MRKSSYAANSAWQQLVALAHNLLTNFQVDTGRRTTHAVAETHGASLTRTVQTLRFEVFHRAAILVRPDGRVRLRPMNNVATRRVTRIAKDLARAAQCF
jgi:prolyl-tRNA editing enzyme YbaK/EbsC (Cys-tRNA(Pro) deacylase)